MCLCRDKVTQERTRADSAAQTSKQMEVRLLEEHHEIANLTLRVESLEDELRRAIQSKTDLLNSFSDEMERWRDRIRQASARPSP